MGHHTKDKGDLGLGFVIAALLGEGVQAALPLSEHLPFDCIAISKNGQLARLSVKYRKETKGVVTVRLRSTWADRHGSHVKKHQRGDYDAFAIYCPDTKGCYFVRMDEVKGETLTLRVKPATRKSRSADADDFIDPNRIFAPVA